MTALCKPESDKKYEDMRLRIEESAYKDGKRVYNWRGVDYLTQQEVTSFYIGWFGGDKKPHFYKLDSINFDDLLEERNYLHLLHRHFGDEIYQYMTFDQLEILGKFDRIHPLLVLWRDPEFLKTVLRIKRRERRQDKKQRESK